MAIVSKHKIDRMKAEIDRYTKESEDRERKIKEADKKLSVKVRLLLGALRDKATRTPEYIVHTRNLRRRGFK